MKQEIINYLQACNDSNKLDIMVVSYGGSGSNTMVNYLSSLNFKCKSPTWHNIFCHFPEPLDCFKIKCVYIYDDPRSSFMSMKRRNRGYWDKNQMKLSNNWKTELSDENLLELMIKQFMAWTKHPRNNIFIISKKDFFSEKRNDLFNFLNISPEVYPIWEKPHQYNFKKYKKLFKKYEKEINYINNYRKSSTG